MLPSWLKVSMALTAALFVAAACRREDPEPEKKDRLLSVTVSETTLVLQSGGSVEISFRVV